MKFYFYFYLYPKTESVVVISYKTLRHFYNKYPDAKDALNNWFLIAEEANWANFNEMRSIFGSADAVENDLYVFNIRGGNYRLIVRIILRARRFLSSL